MHVLLYILVEFHYLKIHDCTVAAVCLPNNVYVHNKAIVYHSVKDICGYKHSGS